MVICIRILLTIMVLLIPFCIGTLFINRKETITLYRLIEGAILGQFLLWAIFQVAAIPLIQLRVSFSLLFWLYTCTIIILIMLSLRHLIGHTWSLHIHFPKISVIWLILLLCVGLILFQAGYYVFGMHLDEDDARWIAEAGDALVKDRMFLHNPATGEYLGKFMGEMKKDAYSPLPMFYAVLSRWAMIRPAVMAHTIIAPIMLLLSYAIFFRMGCLLFEGSEERIIFMLAVATINMFFYGGSDSEAAFSLIRIWQGKAIIAGVTIPMILSQIILIQQEDTVKNWLILCLISCASSLLSGMGMIISLIMISGYGFYVVVICGRLKRFPLWILALLPAGIFELLSQLLS